MASLGFSSIKPYSYSKKIDRSNRVKHESSFFGKTFPIGKKVFCRNLCENPGVTISNVATKPPPEIAAPSKQDAEINRKHVAWTSVRQEPWQGELDVQGVIPLWLVCIPLDLHFIDEDTEKHVLIKFLVANYICNLVLYFLYLVLFLLFFLIKYSLIRISRISLHKCIYAALYNNDNYIYTYIYQIQNKTYFQIEDSD